MSSTERSSGQSLQAFPWVAAYWTISSGMIVFNFVAVRGLGLPFLILAYQILVTIIYAYWQDPRTCNQVLQRPSNLRLWLLAAFLFCATIASSMQALLYVSMQTVLVARNLTMVAIALVDAVIFKFKLTAPMLSSITVALVGISMFVIHDLVASNITGYAWLGLNVLAICAHHTLSKKALSGIRVSRLGDFDVVHIIYMQGLAFPMLLLLALLSGELLHLRMALMTSSARTLTAVLLSGVIGVLISRVGTQVQRLLAATSYILLTNLNKIFTFVLAQLVEQHRLPAVAKVGIIVSFVGSFVYSYLSGGPSIKNASALRLAPWGFRQSNEREAARRQQRGSASPPKSSPFGKAISPPKASLLPKRSPHSPADRAES